MPVCVFAAKLQKYKRPILIGIILVALGFLGGLLWGVTATGNTGRYAMTAVNQSGPRLNYINLGDLTVAKLTSASDANIYIIRNFVKNFGVDTIGFSTGMYIPSQPSIKLIVQYFVYHRGDGYVTCVKTEITRIDDSTSTDLKSERVVLTPGTPIAEAVDKAERIMGLR